MYIKHSQTNLNQSHYKYTLNNTRKQGKHKEIKIALAQYIDIEKKAVIAKHFRPYIENVP
jgi:hypothetical protein